MINWADFVYFAATASFCWLAGALLSTREKMRSAAIFSSITGTLVFFAFIVGMWLSLERPPMRTQGETRLWYSLFLSLVGIVIYARWKYKWILSFSSMMAIMFTCINLFKPEIHSKTLMPALQSPWFVPHVIVYMFAYAMMGAATIFAIYLWWKSSRNKNHEKGKGVIEEEMNICDTLVRIGWAFLSLGMCMGALWAKEAWGDFWTWDPKETWALATWLSYLLYLHLRPQTSLNSKNIRLLFALLLFSFILLQMCWWGVNYLPSAQGSVHTY